MIKLARLLTRYSCKVGQGDRVLIEATGAPAEFVAALVNEAYQAGGQPLVELRDPKVERALRMGLTQEQVRFMAQNDAARMAGCRRISACARATTPLKWPMCPPISRHSTHANIRPRCI